ncbi:MAG TPA: hypothetical protein VGN15_08685 [Ktedonobacteraceae bacterium]|jgi:hypothetical protein|nr:hypothetical protein [Ktedonobacteraceae bacterium]
MKGLTEGWIVHFVLKVPHEAELQHRPAIVVRNWKEAAGTVNLTVFTDWSNDGPANGMGIVWKTSVPYSEEPKEYTWHWPEWV